MTPERRAERFRALIHNLNIGVYRNTPGPKGRFIEANPAILRIFGYDNQAEFFATPVSGLYQDPHDRDRFLSEVAKTGSIKNHELRLKKRDGTPFFGSVSAVAVRDATGKVQYFDGVIEDVSAYRQMIKGLKERKEMYTAIMQQASEGIYLLDPDTKKVHESNRSFQAMVGYRQDELCGKVIYDLLAHPKADVDYQIQRIQLKKTFFIGERRYRCKNGSVLDVEASAHCIQFAGKRMLCVVVRNISEHKSMMEKLYYSERRFKDLFNSISDLVYAHDLEGYFLSVNPAVINAFGFGEHEIIGRKITDFMKPEFRSDFDTSYLEHIKAHGTHEGISTFFAKDGRKVYVESHSSLANPEDGGPYITGMGRDVTQKILSERKIKKLQSQILQAQKMEAVGTLAGGIAHDFNNLLMGIQGHCSLLMVGRKPSDPDLEHLKQIADIIKKATGLTRQLLGFAKRSGYEAKATDINTLISTNCKMFGRTQKEIRVHEKYQQPVWTVEIDQGQMERALLNLFINARQAMPDSGGDLYLQTENITLDKDFTAPFNLKAGRYVKISVTDTGTGMDEDTKTRIFEPFFTTKDMGRGTGLGLASVYGIVTNHAGIINVHSEVGRGTTFEIYLPAFGKPVKTEETSLNHILKGKGTVLLVDDEEMVIEVNKDLLIALGYRVLKAKSGEEAVTIFTERKDEIDFVILDMIMPGMDGGATYDSLKEISPGIKVLLSSGYSINGQTAKILDRGCSGFIQKPFNIRQLSKKLAELNGSPWH